MKPWLLKSLCLFAQVTDVFSCSFFLPSCPPPTATFPQRRTDRLLPASAKLPFLSLPFPWPLLLFSPLPTQASSTWALNWHWPLTSLGLATASFCYFGLHVSESCHNHCTCRTHQPPPSLPLPPQERRPTQERKREWMMAWGQRALAQGSGRWIASSKLCQLSKVPASHPNMGIIPPHRVVVRLDYYRSRLWLEPYCIVQIPHLVLLSLAVCETRPGQGRANSTWVAGQRWWTMADPPVPVRTQTASQAL